MSEEFISAAAIAYAKCSRPGWVPAEFGEHDGEEMDFYVLRTLDGSRCEAVVRQPLGTVRKDTPLVISVHGSGANFAMSAAGAAVRHLTKQGIAVLGINTRQHDERNYTDNFFDVQRDLDAAIYTARALGYGRIYLQGQSLGNIQVLYWAATNWDTDIQGVILTGMFAKLPWKSRHFLIQDEKHYAELFEESRRLTDERRPDAVLPFPMRVRIAGEGPARATAEHFLTYRSEQVSVADGEYWIKRTPQPVLLVRDEGDVVIRDFEPNILVSAAQSPDSLVPSVEFHSIPNPTGLNARGHLFSDTEAKLIDVMTSWIQRREAGTLKPHR